MKTTAVGQDAENAVADYLQRCGFNITDKNWRTRWCEIDIIAQKDKTAYFIEVKYRSNAAQGSGFEYIGPNKLRQLTFAVDFWIAQNNWNGDCRLYGAQVSGNDYGIIELTEIE
jgi:uncharacterized protein (TIGR00252 family)